MSEEDMLAAAIAQFQQGDASPEKRLSKIFTLPPHGYVSSTTKEDCSGSLPLQQADFLSVFAFLKAHSRCYVTERENKNEPFLTR
jgi:hypothetical protein